MDFKWDLFIVDRSRPYASNTYCNARCNFLLYLNLNVTALMDFLLYLNLNVIALMER